METTDFKAIARQRQIRRELRNVYSTDARVRTRAKQFVRSLGPESIEELLPILRADAAKVRRIRHVLVVTALTYAAVSLLATYALYHRPPTWRLLIDGLNVFNIIAGLTIAAVLQRHRGAIGALSRIGDQRAAAPITAALAMNDPATSKLARDALVALLPKLRASDASLLEPNHRRILDRELGRSARKRPELALAILAAWEQAGDESSIPAVQKLADAAPGDRIRPAVVARARECLPLLRISADRLRTHSELLRASSEAPGTEAELLRAAGGAVGSSSENLLRATEEAADPTPAAELPQERSLRAGL